MREPQKVAVVGSGYVGTVVAACFAAVGHRVVAVEIDEAKRRRLTAGQLPFYEPGLPELLVEGLESGRLAFTGALAEALEAAEVTFLCVGTPSNSDGSADLSAVEAAARAIGASLNRFQVVVAKSTVPIGSSAWLARLIEESIPEHRRPDRLFSVVSNPEFLREGSAVEDFFNPDRVVVGGEDPDAVRTVAELYRPILERARASGRRPPLIITDSATAEMGKYAANAFLATKISFINEIAAICERVGADVRGVADIIGVDHRIGRHFLGAGVGWGGSCFPKDLAALVATSDSNGHRPELLEAVRSVNQRQRQAVVEKLERHLGDLEGCRVALLGLAFKPGTDDLRDAPSLDIAAGLVERGAAVIAHDPAVTSVSTDADCTIAANPYDAARNADAVVLITDWPEYGALDLVKLGNVMAGELLIDGRNFIEPEEARAAGLRYEGFGRRPTP